MTLIRDGGAVAAAALAATVLTISPAPAAQGFAGQWAATDGDGSNLTLGIRGGPARFAVREIDDAATVCGGASASVNGSGTATGTLLTVTTTVTCRPGGNVVRQRVQITFSLDTTTDTLTDNAGVLWNRTT